MKKEKNEGQKRRSHYMSVSKQNHCFYTDFELTTWGEIVHDQANLMFWLGCKLRRSKKINTAIDLFSVLNHQEFCVNNILFIPCFATIGC